MPWDKQTLGVVDICPYRFLNVLTSEFSNESTINSPSQPASQELAPDLPECKTRLSVPQKTRPPNKCDVRTKQGWTPMPIEIPENMNPTLDGKTTFLGRKMKPQSPDSALKSEPTIVKPLCHTILDLSLSDRASINPLNSMSEPFLADFKRPASYTPKNLHVLNESLLNDFLPSNNWRGSSDVDSGNESSFSNPAQKGFVSLRSETLKSIMGSNYKPSPRDGKGKEVASESNSKNSYASCTSSRSSNAKEGAESFYNASFKAVGLEVVEVPVSGHQDGRRKKENARRKKNKRLRKALGVEKSGARDEGFELHESGVSNEI